jgi:hypothetical protein
MLAPLPGRDSLAAGFRRLRYASAPANIHRASGAEEFASNIDVGEVRSSPGSIEAALGGEVQS